MPTPAIRVEGLGKKYRLTHGRERGNYRTLRESITDFAKAPFRRRGSTEEFWALNDVSFEVQPGEVVGIIGRNGAGKSTLLKILSRITKPTKGHVTLNGRVGSLLEVGTGFHPELTGRENIYLNGSILGMSRSEIAKKFDEIVAFAEVEKFLDTPVKRYSSGMYVRLAFAVAAHLEPEILIVDEVLAVGDAGFQKKCLAKIEAIGKHGLSIVFVSHDLKVINRICGRAMCITGGRISAIGASHEITSQYIAAVTSRLKGRNEHLAAGDGPVFEKGSEIVKLTSVSLHDDLGPVASSVDIRRPLTVRMSYDVIEAGSVLIPNIHFFSDDERYIFVTHDWSADWRRRPRPPGTYSSEVTIPGNFLSEGLVTVGIAISTYLPSYRVHFFDRYAATFQVCDTADGSFTRGDFSGFIPGPIRPLLEWNTTAQV